MIFNWVTDFISNSTISIAKLNCLISGNWYALWYMYMLLWIYMLVPLFIRLKDGISRRQYTVAVMVLLLWSCGSQIFSEYELQYCIGNVISFSSYVLLGDLIYSNRLFMKQKIKQLGAVTLVILAIAVILRMGGEKTTLQDLRLI